MRKTKKHPALKHAGYSAMALLPGESRADFEKLHADLISEFAPAGAYEDEIVADMAGLIWRKRNLATFRMAQQAQRYYENIRREKEPEPTLKPMPGYATLEQILGMKPPDPVKVKAAAQAAVAQARKELGWAYEFVDFGEVATIDRLKEEIDVRGRLDAMLDGCVKRLLHVRGLKSISPASHAAQPTLVPALPNDA
jgi:hypothetical protein